MKSFVAIVFVVGIVSVSANGWEPANDCGCGAGGLGGSLAGGLGGDDGGALAECGGQQTQQETTLTRIFGRPIQIKPEDAELVLSPSPIIVKPTLIHRSSPVVIRPTIISRPQPARVSVAQPIFRVQNEVQRLPALQMGGCGAGAGVAGGADGAGAHGGSHGVMSSYSSASVHGGKHY